MAFTGGRDNNAYSDIRFETAAQSKFRGNAQMWGVILFYLLPGFIFLFHYLFIEGN